MFHQSSQTPLYFINSVFGPWNVGNHNFETLSIGTMDFWVEIYNKSRSECKNDNNTEGMVCFKRILTLSNPRLRESNKPASVWAVSAMAWMFLCRQKIKKKEWKPMAYQSPLAPSSSHILWDWQTVLSPKIRQRKIKTDGQDGALAGALTCSLQAPRDLLYSPQYFPLPPCPCSLPCSLWSLFHVAHGTNKYRGTPSTYTNADSDLSISPRPSAGQVASFFPKLDRQPWLTNHEDRLSCPLRRSKNQLSFFFFCFVKWMLY